MAYYALEVLLNGESKIVNENGYLFYTHGETNYLLGYTGASTELTLPANYNGENYEIYKYSFYYKDKITKVTIPDSVTSIGYSAFGYCTNLTSIKYRGTETQWNAISKSSNWNKYYSNGVYYTISCTITYNYTGE